jgi:hypothetical protein
LAGKGKSLQTIAHKLQFLFKRPKAQTKQKVILDQTRENQMLIKFGHQFAHHAVSSYRDVTANQNSEGRKP